MMASTEARLCCECAQPIGFLRLRAVPEADRCIACQSRADHAESLVGRGPLARAARLAEPALAEMGEVDAGELLGVRRGE
jgi:RNA polymerase-binding transcription factor DksA